MIALIRRKFEMFRRVREFSRTHSSPDTAYAAMVAELEAGLAEADGLIAREQTGRADEHGAAQRRLALRDAMHQNLVRNLVRIGEAAAAKRGPLTAHFQLPSVNLSTSEYLAALQRMLEAANANKELFREVGMAESLLQDLAAMLTELGDVVERGDVGRSVHVGARRDLEALSVQLTEVVDRLDSFNRYRFRDDVEPRRSWDSIRTVLTRVRKRPEEAVTPPAPAADEVKPAA